MCQQLVYIRADVNAVTSARAPEETPQLLETDPSGTKLEEDTPSKGKVHHA